LACHSLPRDHNGGWIIVVEVNEQTALSYDTKIAILSHCPYENSVLLSMQCRTFMVEHVTNIVISVGSIVLFGYWFRYACMLILATKTAQDYSDEVAASNQLDFREVRSVLREQFEINLDILHSSLKRDYTFIIYLLKHTPASRGECRIEAAMLRLHYLLMSTWFRLTRRFLGASASRALEEMSLVIAYMANMMGERKRECALGCE
jgi:hypothetical protein